MKSIAHEKSNNEKKIYKRVSRPLEISFWINHKYLVNPWRIATRGFYAVINN